MVFSAKIRKTFWEGDTTPSPDPSSSGEGDTPSPRPTPLGACGENWSIFSEDMDKV